MTRGVPKDSAEPVAIDTAANGGGPLDLRGRVALRTVEAAEALGVSDRTLRSMLAELPHFRVGRRILIPVGPLINWAAEQAERRASQDERLVDEIAKAMGS